MISELLRFKDDGGRTAYEEFAEEFQQMLEDSGGEVVLSVQAEMPIVSEEYWDHFVAFRFPSRDGMERLYQSGSFAELNEKRIAGIDGSLAVLHTMDPARAKDCR